MQALRHCGTRRLTSIPLRQFVRFHGVSRQAYYHYQNHQANERLKQEMVLQLVCQIRSRQPRIGVRKLYQLLKRQFEHLGLQLGRDALFDLLREYGLLIASSKRGHRTTCANHRFYRYPNRITDLVVDRIHQVFVADITYLQTIDGFVYLALVTDLFSNKIVGFDVSDSLSVEGALRACKMAIKPVTQSDALIHHSDRGGPILLSGLYPITSLTRRTIKHDSKWRCIPEPCR